MLARAITPALNSGELPAKQKQNDDFILLTGQRDDEIKEKRTECEKIKVQRQAEKCLYLLSRLMRGSTDLLLLLAASGSQFLYLSTEETQNTTLHTQPLDNGVSASVSCEDEDDVKHVL